MKDMFINDTEDLPVEDIYKLDEPLKKKRKGKKDKKERKTKERTVPSPASEAAVKKSKRQHQKKAADLSPIPHHDNPSIDALMGLSDNDEGSDQDRRGSGIQPGQDGKQPLKTQTVDAQTRRDYWLSKGQAL